MRSSKPTTVRKDEAGVALGTGVRRRAARCPRVEVQRLEACGHVVLDERPHEGETVIDGGLRHRQAFDIRQPGGEQRLEPRTAFGTSGSSPVAIRARLIRTVSVGVVRGHVVHQSLARSCAPGDDLKSARARVHARSSAPRVIGAQAPHGCLRERQQRTTVRRPRARTRAIALH